MIIKLLTFIRELVKKGEIEVAFCSTKVQIT